MQGYYFRSNSVGTFTSLCKASRALAAILRRRAFSSSISRSALPIGLTILTAVTTRLEPTISATGVIVQTWATGSPVLSISLVSAAPQRVLVPQVEVRITPDTPSDLSSVAIACPILLAFSTAVATPVVL
jgi:hypothetical protein